MPAASRGGRAGKGEVAVEKGSCDCRSKALRLIEAGEGSGDLLGATQEGLAGMANDLSNGIEQQEA